MTVGATADNAPRARGGEVDRIAGPWPTFYVIAYIQYFYPTLVGIVRAYEII